MPSDIGRVPDTNDDDDTLFNICSISSLQSPYDDTAVPSKPEHSVFPSDSPQTCHDFNLTFPVDDGNDGLNSVADMEGNKVGDCLPTSVGKILSEPSLALDCRRPLEPAVTLQSPEGEDADGLWFKSNKSTRVNSSSFFFNCAVIFLVMYRFY